MSPRDLPLWVRGATGLLLVAAAWYVANAEALVAVMGPSLPQLSAGVVAVSVLLGMRLPLDLWPHAPRREPFSLRWSLGAALIAGLLIVSSAPTGLARSVLVDDPSGLIAVVVGGVGWALGWGASRHTTFRTWYAVAGGLALAPPLIGMLAAGITGGQLAPVSVRSFVGAAAFCLVATGAQSLVTQELAFRRLLVGRSRDAGLVVVLAAAVSFGLWGVLATGGEANTIRELVTGTLTGVVLGSLYQLSGSLLVPALYQGVQSAVVHGLQLERVPSPGWGAAASLTAIISTILAYHVVQRSGFVGSSKPARVTHVAGD